MEDLETPYDAFVHFIQCKICEKSIRGETLYKIHLTSLGHLKNEELLLRQGVDITPQNLPVFRDIIHYLDYLKLDEPIIGLNYVEKVSSAEKHGLRLQYVCNLCCCSAVLTEMVCHLIGRKHRQKYVTAKRPDLVTWDSKSFSMQTGKLIRAKAEVIERQYGSGTPLISRDGKKDKFNNFKGPMNDNQNRGQTNPQNQNPSGKIPPLLPDLKGHKNTFSNQRRYPEDQLNVPAFPVERPDASRDRWRQSNNEYTHNRMEGELQREDYRDSHMYRDSERSDRYNEHADQYTKDPPRRAGFEQEKIPWYGQREEMPHGQAQKMDGFSKEQHSYDGSFKEMKPLTDFYPEFKPSQQAYPVGDNQQWSRESGPERHDAMYRGERQDLSEPAAKRRNFPPLADSEPTHSRAFGIVRDYQHERGTPLRNETLNYTEPVRPGDSTSHIRDEVTKAISEMPEPFRRFLMSSGGDDGHAKRKRKSRFTDATPEEVEMTKKINLVDDRHTNRNFGGNNPGSRSMDSRMNYSDFREPQKPLYSEGNQGGSSHSDGVFGLLKNVEIDNPEEAEFLKSKLCNLLKEFKSKKQEKESYDGYNPGSMSGNYGDSNSQLPRHSLFEAPQQEKPKDHYFDRDHRRELIPQHQEYPNRPIDTARQLSRSHNEGMFGKAHPSHLNETPYYPERFPQSLHSHDYQPPVKQFYDSPNPLAQEPRMHSEQRYSKTLDKITSTLLELVSRK